MCSSLGLDFPKEIVVLLEEPGCCSGQPQAVAGWVLVGLGLQNAVRAAARVLGGVVGVLIAFIIYFLLSGFLVTLMVTFTGVLHVFWADWHVRGGAALHRPLVDFLRWCVCRIAGCWRHDTAQSLGAACGGCWGVGLNVQVLMCWIWCPYSS